MRIADLDLSTAEDEAVFACLIAQMHDVHALVWSLSAEQVVAAEGLDARLPYPSDDPLVGVLSKALAYLVHDTDHFDMDDAEIAAGQLALADFAPRFGAILS